MDPPRFTRGNAVRNCASCEHYIDIDANSGTCRKYDRPMFRIELCDSWTQRGVKVWEKGGRKA